MVWVFSLCCGSVGWVGSDELSYSFLGVLVLFVGVFCYLSGLYFFLVCIFLQWSLKSERQVVTTGKL